MARRHTPYFHRMSERGAQFVDRIGFEAALVFTSTREEHLATRSAAGVYDVYGQGPIDVKGPDAEAVLDGLAPRSVVQRAAAEGRVLYTSLLNAQGGIVDDLTLYRLGPEHFWLIPTPSRAVTVDRLIRDAGSGRRVYVTNIVSGTAYLSVQGPCSRDLLARLTDADLSSAALPYFRFIHADVAEVPMLVSRTGYSGELGYELYYSREYAEHVWDALFEAGRDDGVVPAGLGALRSVRIEKKYPLYGLDLDETTTPIEAGLAWTVDVDGRDFVGRDVLVRQQAEGVDRRLVGLELVDPEAEPPAAGSTVDLDGLPIGAVTSSDRGHALERTLALGYVTPETADGATVAVAGAAAVVKLEPFYDPTGARLRS